MMGTVAGWADTVVTPTLSVPSGVSAVRFSLTVQCATTGAVIHYSTTGSDPTEADSTLSSGGTLLIDQSLTLKAKAFKSGWTASAVASEAYQITGAIEAGDTFSLALLADGTLAGWGNESNGRLLSTGSSSRLSPRLVVGNSGYEQISAGRGGYVLALKGDGTVDAWGVGSNGVLGNNSTSTTTTVVHPSFPSSPTPVLRQVCAGYTHSAAVDTAGNLWTWGLNSSGQLGLGDTTGPRTTPQKVNHASLLGHVAMVALGSTHTVVLKDDHTVWSMGNGASQQLGNNTASGTSFNPVQVLKTGLVALTGIVAVSAGNDFSIALDSNGKVWAWGSGSSGRLGTGNTTSSPIAIQLPYFVTTFPSLVIDKIVTGDAHTLALGSNGHVYAWGNGGNGRLGNGGGNATAPYDHNVNAVEIAAGTGHSFIVLSGGSVKAFGDGTNGRLGLGNTTIFSTPQTVPNFNLLSDDADADGLTNIAETSALTDPFDSDTDNDGMLDGYEVTYGLNPLVNDAATDLDGDGLTNQQEATNGTNPNDYYNGGAPNYTLTGNNQTGPARNFLTSPIKVLLKNASNQPLLNAPVRVAVQAGGGQLASSNSAFATFSSSVIGTTDSSGYFSVWYRQGTTSGITSDLAFQTKNATTYNTLVVLHSTTGAATVAAPESNQSFLFQRSQTSLLIKSATLDSVIRYTIDGTDPIATSPLLAEATPLAIYRTLTVKARAFVAGVGESAVSTLTIPVTGLIKGGGDFTFASTWDRKIFAWGSGNNYRLGTGLTAAKQTPFLLTNGMWATAHIVDVAAGNNHALALDETGQVWAWGGGTSGQIGDDESLDQQNPIALTSMTNARAIAAGNKFSVALKNDQTVWAWGLGTSGQLGHGDNATSDVPVSVNSLKNIVQIAAGDSHALAVDQEGHVYTWGLGTSGQLGNGASVSSSGPVSVSGLTNIKIIAVAAGKTHSLALDENGNVYAWGSDANGELGNGATTGNKNVPAQVQISLANPSLYLTNIRALAVGEAHNLALDLTGHVWVWGSGASSQLGNGAATSTVANALTTLSNIVAVGAGQKHSLAIGDDGHVWVWGNGSSYRLGNNNTIDLTTPFDLTSSFIASLLTSDGDSDGMHDSWEMQYFGTVTTAANGNPDGDDRTNLQEFQQKSNPFDYYNGAAPTLTRLSGNEQNGSAAAFLAQPLVVEIKNGTQALNNAPVTFSVTQGSAQLASTNQGAPTLSSTLSVTTAANGQAQVYVWLPAGATGSMQITVNAGIAVPVVFTVTSNDSDGDGLPDPWEETHFGVGNLTQTAIGNPDGDGLTNLQEYQAGTDPNDVDTDYDGSSDSEEVTDGTNPLSASSVTAKRLAYWSFDANFLGERGQSPLSVVNMSRQTTWHGAGAYFGSSPLSLRYKDVEADGKANINLARGTIAFWYRPDWTSASLGGTGPGVWSRLMAVGRWTADFSQPFWEILLSYDGNSMEWNGGNGIAAGNFAGTTIQFREGHWYHLAFVYSATETKIYVDGVLKSTWSGVAGYYPNKTSRAQYGINWGSNHDQGESANGVLEDIETFNYAMTAPQVTASYDALRLLDADTDDLPDVWEFSHFGDANQTAEGNIDGDYWNNLEEYQNGTDPNDYFDAQTPFLEIISGDNQARGPGAFCGLPLVVEVTNAAHEVLRNAPVTFEVTDGGGSLTSTNEGAPSGVQYYSTVTDTEGRAQVYFCPPESPSGSHIMVTAGTGLPVYFWEEGQAELAGLAAWWKLDETSGSTVTDSSGAANPGLVQNNAVRVAGVFGPALTLNGTNQSVTVENSFSLKIGQRDLTLSAWFKTGATGILPLYSKYAEGQSGYYVGLNEGMIEVKASGSGNGLNDILFRTVDVFANNQWHQVIVILDANAKQAKVYVDGRLRTLQIIGGVGVLNSSGVNFSAVTVWNLNNLQPLSIGADPAEENYFSGVLDDLKIYDQIPLGDDFNLLWDRDENGLADAWEIQNFGHLGVASGADSDGDSFDNLAEFLQGDNPNDFYSQNGTTLTPVLEIVNGDGQSGLAGTFASAPLVVRIHNGVGGPVIPGAPIKFTVMNGAQALASISSLAATRTSTMTLSTDTNGEVSHMGAETYFLLPATADTTAYVETTAGSALGVIFSFASDPLHLPTAPSNLQVSIDGNGDIHLEWEDNSNDETGFKIERSLDAGMTWQTIATVGPNITEYTDTTVPSGASAFYRVSAINDDGPSGSSNTMAQDGSALADALGLTVLSLEYDKNRVEWGNPPTGTSVTVERKGSDGSFTALGTFSAGTHSYLDTGEGVKGHERKLYRLKLSGPDGLIYSHPVVERDPFQYVLIDLGEAGAPLRVTEKGVVLLQAKTGDINTAGYRWKEAELTPLEGDGEVLDMNEEEKVVGWGWSRGTAAYHYWGGGEPYPGYGQYLPPREINVFKTGVTWLPEAVAALGDTLTTFYDELGSYNYGEMLHFLFGWEAGSSNGGIFQAEKIFNAITDDGTVYSHQLWAFGTPLGTSSRDSFAGGVQLGQSTQVGGLKFMVTRASDAGYVGYSELQGESGVGYPLVNGVETAYTPVDITNAGLIVGHNGDDIGHTTQLTKILWNDGTNLHEFETNEAPVGINEHKDIISAQSIWELDPTQTNIHLRHSLNDRISDQWEILAAKDLSDSKLVVVLAKKTKDDEGNPILPENQVPEPALLARGELMVDGNRDGQMDFDDREIHDLDVTSEDKPFRFWVNDDRDGFSPVSGETDVQDDLDPSSGTLNGNSPTIACKRDLEDFSRLWIYLGGLQQAIHDGNIMVGMEWKEFTDDPQITIFQAAEADGGTEYLTDNTVAQQQMTAPYNTQVIELNHRNVINKNNPYIFPVSFWTNLTENTPTTHLLFQGVKRGKGKLVLSFYKSDGTTKIGEGPGVYMDLKNIKELYERWTVGDGDGGAPAASASISTARLPFGVTGLQYNQTNFGLSVPEDQNGNKYILFVHGWNVPPWEKDAFAETMFKRLYSQGYKGKFGTFQWPTTYNEYSDYQSIFSYDDGEYSAWRSAVPLSGLLGILSSKYGGSVYVLAHSMGNVVTGEALRLAAQSGAGQLVDTYAASQAAVPGHCYDPGLTGNDLLTFGALGILGPKTPNIYNNWMVPVAPHLSAVGTKANFYNVNDYALGKWQTDQVTKPDVRTYTYYYDSTNTSQIQDLFKKAIVPPISEVNLHLGDVSNVQDRYEIMAYASEPRSKALGGVTTVNGFSAQNLPGIWPADSTGHNYADHRWHSAQFRFTNMDQHDYWHTLLNQFRLLPNQ